MFPVICIEFLENIWVQPITVPPCLLLTQVERDAVRKRQTRPPTPATRARTARFLRLQNLHFFASQSEDRPATCVSNDNDKTCRERVRVLPGSFFLYNCFRTKKATPFRDRVCMPSAGRFAIPRSKKSKIKNPHVFKHMHKLKMHVWKTRKVAEKKRRNIHGPEKTIP